MPRPTRVPIGVELSRAAREVSRALDGALVQAGGSLPTWTILLALLSNAHATQRDIARAVGLEGPTLTHHLGRMEADGLVARERDPSDRRAQVVRLSARGEDEFRRLRTTVADFDRRLRSGLDDDEVEQLRDLLVRLRAGVAGEAGA